MDAPRGNPPVDRTRPANQGTNSSNTNQPAPLGRPSGHWADNLPEGWARGDAGLTLLDPDGELSHSIHGLDRSHPGVRNIVYQAASQARLLEDRNWYLADASDATKKMNDLTAAAKEVLANDQQFIEALRDEANTDPVVVKAKQTLQTVQARLEIARQTAKRLGQHEVDLTPLHKELSDAQEALDKAQSGAQHEAPQLGTLNPAHYPASEQSLRRIKQDYMEAARERSEAKAEASRVNNAIVAGEKKLTEDLRAGASPLRRLAAQLPRRAVIRFAALGVAALGMAYLAANPFPYRPDLDDQVDRLERSIKSSQWFIDKGRQVELSAIHLRESQAELNALCNTQWLLELALNFLFAASVAAFADFL